MLRILLTFFVCSFVTISSKSHVAGSATAAYSAHVSYSIEREKEAKCKSMTNHAQCPQCREFDAKQHVGTSEQWDAIQDVYVAFPHVERPLIWTFFISKVSQHHVSAEITEQDNKEFTALTAEFDRQTTKRELVKNIPAKAWAVLNRKIDISPLMSDMCKVSFVRNTQLHEQALLTALRSVSDIPIPVLDIVNAYVLYVPLGFNNQQIGALCRVVSVFTNTPEELYDRASLKKVLSRSRCMLYSAQGIEKDDYGTVDLSHNSITQINRSDLDFETLTLDLSYNMVSVIEDCAFQRVFDADQGRTKLILSNNQLSCITRAMLSMQSSSDLHYLDLSHNEIYDIEVGAFSRHQGLKTIDLSYNKLERVPQELFSMTQLEIINLDGNPLLPDEQKRYKELKAELLERSQQCVIS